MKTILSSGLKLILLLLILQFNFAQTIDLENIIISRDKFGVPYIQSKTDIEAVYGLAWVQAEDNFHDIQESLLAVKGLLSSTKGKKGVLLDAISFVIDTKGTVDRLYDEAFSEEFKPLISAYTAALNKYAELNPKEVRNKKLFPINEKNIIQLYVLNMAFISNLQFDFIRIFKNKMAAIENHEFPSGSNGFAVSPQRTKEGNTFLVSNSHQPLRGFASWYEVQIHTDEGWDFHGATFAAGITPFVGTNNNLAWTHCTNYDDFDDVYELKMHPSKKLHYSFDGEWLPLTKRKMKLKVKIAGIKIPISRTFYWSKHGPVLKNKSGFYAIRFPAILRIGQAEQWYRMNKSQNFDEFYAALEMQQASSQNVIYGDKEGNIMFLGNGLFPYRNPNYNWRKIVPGDTSATLWKDEFYPLDSLVFVKNPVSGYVFNSNNSGFDCTAKYENPDPKDFNSTMGHQTGATARSIRFHALIDTIELLSYKDLKRIKYDSKMEFPLHTRSLENLDLLRQLDPIKYPDIKEAIEALARWNGDTEVDNKQAALFSLSVQYLAKYLREEQIRELNNSLEEVQYANALRFAKKHLLKYFGTLEITLGDLQKHVRGEKEIGIWGVPEVLTQMYTKKYENGKYQTSLGDSFILFATFNTDGIQNLETINCYGSSNKKDSKHYSDQMDLFVKKQLKSISLNPHDIKKNAIRSYHPK